MKFSLCLYFCSFVFFSLCSTAQQNSPVRIGVIGLTHTHVHWILGSDVKDIQVVGIVEPNMDLAQRYAKQHGYSMDIVYSTMDEMIAITKPEAVTAFGTIYEHLEVIEKCAPLGIHVMVEKPLAVNMEHAMKMKELAKKHKIHLLTNYETTWYASNAMAKKLTDEGALGKLNKIVVHDGHQGPMEIGVNKEFLDWLTDPVDNGAGALTDFGCYGANLSTWLLNGERPISVTALTQQLKPDIYPKVDDDATIIVQYPKAQAVLMASWNWPFNRKDMEVYGKTGYFFSDSRSDVRIRLKNDETYTAMVLEELSAPYNDPFSYFAAIIRNRIEPEAYNLSSLENNILVVEILEAAKESAKTGKTVILKKN